MKYSLYYSLAEKSTDKFRSLFNQKKQEEKFKNPLNKVRFQKEIQESSLI